MSNLLKTIVKNRLFEEPEEMSLEDYLDAAKSDSRLYESPAERLLRAIGEPEILDTSKDARLSRIFSNRIIKRYAVFKDFHGMEDTVDQVVSYLKHSAQSLEEKKQILYLLGPVGGGKSTLAEKLKSLMEVNPIYAIKGSPIHESPLGLIPKEHAEELGIPERYFKERLSPWALKRLKEFGGDITKFKVVKLFPSQSYQIAVAKTEPGDENNQDISALVGKIDIRKLSDFSQNDPDAYSYSGGLCLANQGLLEFVEMFKAPLKVLHPLLTATQEGNYNGTEALSSIPFDGIVLAHSNEAEWKSFKEDKNNEAFIDRVYIVKVPYCLRVTEEVKIYKKLLDNSSLKNAICAPKTLETLAEFVILSRLIEPDNSNVFSKLKVYDGQNIKDKDPKSKSHQEYKESAGLDEGFSGVSTRFAFKVLAKVFNFDATEIAANPVHLFFILEQQLNREQLTKELAVRYDAYIKHLQSNFVEWIGKEINEAYLESFSDYGQNMFDRYIQYADFWMQDTDFRDPDTGEMLNKELLNQELEEIEKAAGISNPKDFRSEVVNFVLRQKAANKGKNPDWRSYNKLRDVIEKKMFTNTEQLLPVISFTGKTNKDDARKHDDFVNRMKEKGYTEKQVKLLVDWFLRVRKSQ